MRGLPLKVKNAKKYLKRKKRRSCFYFNLFAVVVFFRFKDVRAKFSNVDFFFFLKILPLKNDELLMSEM